MFGKSHRMNFGGPKLRCGVIRFSHFLGFDLLWHCESFFCKERLFVIESFKWSQLAAEDFGTGAL